jgi:serine/threonine protein kinase
MEYPLMRLISLIIQALDLIERLRICGVDHRDIDSSNTRVDLSTKSFPLLDFGYSSSPKSVAKGITPSKLGRLRPPDKDLCGHSDTYSLGMMTLLAMHTANISYTLGLRNFIIQSTRAKCTDRVSNTQQLKSILYQQGFTKDIPQKSSERRTVQQQIIFL